MNDSPAVPYSDSDAFKQRLLTCANNVGNISKLAKATGLAQSTIRHYFDKGEPNRHNLIAIARAAQVSIDWLASGLGTPPDNAPPSKQDLDDEQVFQKRFDQILMKFGGVNRLASICKLHPDRLSQVKAGGELNRSELRSLNRYANISADWLLTGETKECPPPPSTQHAPTDIPSVFETTITSQIYDALLAWLSKASPPDGPEFRFSDDLGKVHKTLSQLPSGPLIPWVMNNESMEPKIRRGDFLFFTPTDRINQPEIYMIRGEFGQVMVINAFRKRPHVICKYENPSFNVKDSLEYRADTIKCLGKLVARLTLT